MSPYEVSAVEVAERFGTTDRRRLILRGWLDYRAALRGLGVTRGFQWLDGSFLENKDPNDLDLVVFAHRPDSAREANAWRSLLTAHPDMFDRRVVKENFKLDAFFIDMDGDPESLVYMSRYFLQLFSHQRETFIWKGMLLVRIEDAGDDAVALASLSAAATISSMGGQP